MSFTSHANEKALSARVPGTASKATAPPITTALTATDLQSIYGLANASASGGVGVTVAIVDAYHDPYIQGDLAQYRSENNQPACSTSTGTGCLTEYNQNGVTSSLPAVPPTSPVDMTGWETETALDVEMVSAICPNCSIDLFEANTSNFQDLGIAENSAARVSKFVSNSWGNLDYPGESGMDAKYFNHPGVVLAFAAGDSNGIYGPSYPASSGLVTAVGGTYLNVSLDGSSYTQSVWSGQSTGPGTGTGYGCSSGEGKPSWQSDAGCTNRTQNDVAAVADAGSAAGSYGIWTVSSAAGCGGGCDSYGTSVATPIITAVYALAGTPEANTYPASYLYQPGHGAELTHITSGRVGACESSRAYLCNAAASLSNGYNGPTGWGVPNGANLSAFSSTATGSIVSLDNPGSYDLLAGGRYALTAMKAYDSTAGHALTYSATGLPAGLGINTTNGVIEGVLSTTPANATVKVTARDTTANASATVSFRIASVKSLTATYHATSGLIRLAALGNGSKCMNDARNAAASGTPVQVFTCENIASETGWSYAPNAAPGVPGTIRIHGLCLGANSVHKVAIYTCNGTTGEQWFLNGYAGEIINAASGLCVQGSTVNGAQLTVATCNGAANQAWLMPAAPVTSGITGKCLSLSGSTVVSTACSPSAAQEVLLGFNGELMIGGKCIYKPGAALTDGTVLSILPCPNGATGVSELWSISAYGELQNLVSGKCMAVLNNSAANGARLAIEDCYNQPGEVWGLS